ncbi:MAG: ketosteroid isomerase family protein [Phormidesmis sp.]
MKTPTVPHSNAEQTALNTVEQYFERFNQKQFNQVAVLFDDEGQLCPPFDSPLVGPEKISAYLRRAAKNMTAHPQEWQPQPLETAQWQINVSGKVETSVFKVNVGWQFIVTPTGKIEQASIKLLASPKELLNLRSAVPAS